MRNVRGAFVMARAVSWERVSTAEYDESGIQTAVLFRLAANNERKSGTTTFVMWLNGRLVRKSLGAIKEEKLREIFLHDTHD